MRVGLHCPWKVQEPALSSLYCSHTRVLPCLPLLSQTISSTSTGLLHTAVLSGHTRPSVSSVMPASSLASPLPTPSTELVLGDVMVSLHLTRSLSPTAFPTAQPLSVSLSPHPLPTTSAVVEPQNELISPGVCPVEAPSTLGSSDRCGTSRICPTV